MVLPVSSCHPRDLFSKMFHNSKIWDILLEYRLESPLGRLHGHFESKGCFSTQILPASPICLCLPIKLSCDNLSKSCRKFSKISLFIRKIKKGKGNKWAANKIIPKWTSIVKTEWRPHYFGDSCTRSYIHSDRQPQWHCALQAGP